MRVSKLLQQLREKGTLKKLTLTTTAGDYLLNKKQITFQIKHFGKSNEEVIAIEGITLEQTVVRSHFAPEVQIDDLEVYKGSEQIGMNYIVKDYGGTLEPYIPEVVEKIKEVQVEVVKEVPVVKEVIKEVEVPVEKVVEKEVVKIIEKPIIKEKIIYKDRVLPFKIRFV